MSTYGTQFDVGLGNAAAASGHRLMVTSGCEYDKWRSTES